MSQQKDTLTYNSQTRKWEFRSRPHIRMMLRRMFDAKKSESGDVITLSHTEARAIDIDWLLARYPHDMDGLSRSMLSAVVAAAGERRNQAEMILAGSGGTITYQMEKPPREYQSIAIELCRNQGGIVCGDDLGLGKTIVGIGLATYPDARPMIVVAQTHLQRQWREKFNEFCPFLQVKIAKTGKPEPMGDTDVLIISYSKLKGWAGHTFANSIVFDECQELRHSNSDKYAAAKEMAEPTKYRLGLSATPVYNYGGEMWNISEIMRPGALGDAEEFVREWCSSYSGKWVVKDPPALGAFLREQNLMIRRTRREVGRELPNVMQFAQEVQYDAEVMKALSADALQLARTILAGATFNEKGQAARQLDLKLRQATGISKAPHVARLVADMVKAGKKVILCGWHHEVYRIWQNHFENERVAHWMYTGTESPTRKEASARGFIQHPEGAVMMLSLRSGAGLDGLQTVADTIVFGELDWSPQVHSQCIGRLQRDGLCNDEGVTAFYMVSDAGSDPIIAAILGVKMEQGQGITDPTIEIESTALAVNLSKVTDEQASTNRMVALARDYLARNSKDAKAA